MPTEVIQNYRFGLDTRRSEYTSAIGTLVTLKNAFINQGAEIEKRKTFQPIDLTPSSASGVGNLLGAEPLADSIVLFGGETNNDPNNWPPSGYSYQKLVRNPGALVDGAACDVAGPPSYCTDCVGFAASKKATSVIHSTVFSGKAFVLAGMEDGTICAFYDGVAVADINYHGAILPGMDSLLKLYCAMVLAFDGDENYTVDINDDADGIVVTGNPGREFSIGVEATGTLGVAPPVATFLSGTTPSIPGKVASGFFTIQDGVPRGSVNRIISVKLVTPGGTESKLLTTSAGVEVPVNFTSDPERTAALVVASINAAGTPYNAKNNGNTVTIYADAIGTTDNGKRIKVEVEGQVLIGHCSLAFNGTGFQTDYIKVDGTNILFLMSNPIFPTGGESLTAYVGRLADNINANTSTGAAHGYVAIARQNVLKFSKKVTLSDALATGTDDQPADRGMLPVEVSVSSAGGTGEVTEGNSASLTAKIDLSEVYVKFATPAGPRFPNLIGVIGVTEDEVRCLISGGTPPYKLLWRIEQEQNTALIIANPSLTSTHIRDVATVATVTDLALKRALLYLDVEDADGNKVTTIPVPVRAGWSII